MFRRCHRPHDDTVTFLTHFPGFPSFVGVATSHPVDDASLIDGSPISIDGMDTCRSLQIGKAMMKTFSDVVFFLWKTLVYICVGFPLMNYPHGNALTLLVACCGSSLHNYTLTKKELSGKASR